MPLTWFEPTYPYNLIFDLTNYLLISLIFLLLFRYKIINKNLLIVSLFFLLTPFLFNGFLFEWTYLPDQSKYLGNANMFRENPKLFFTEVNSYSKFKIAVPSIFYAFSPIYSLETYKGIAIWNRALFLFSWIFFTKKNFVDEYNSLIFIFAPSLLFYSSISLRENLIVLSMIWFLYFFYQKKILLTLITLLILSIIKFQSLFTIFIFLFLNFVITENKVRIRSILITLILFLIVFNIYDAQILELINHFRKGFFVEEYGQYKSSSASLNYQFFELEKNFRLFYLIFQGFLNFSLSPFLKGNFSLFSFILFLETVMIFFYLTFRMIKNKKYNNYLFYKWLFILIGSYLFYSIIIFNDGTIHRYKVPIIFFVIFGYFINLKKIKS